MKHQTLFHVCGCSYRTVYIYLCNNRNVLKVQLAQIYVSLSVARLQVYFAIGEVTALRKLSFWTQFASNPSTQFFCETLMGEHAPLCIWRVTQTCTLPRSRLHAQNDKKTNYPSNASSRLTAEWSFCRGPDSVSSKEGEDALGRAGRSREDQGEVSLQSRN